jgi:hypothetical protein
VNQVAAVVRDGHRGRPVSRRNYVREVHRCLKPGAIFKFQVNGNTNARPEPDDTWVGATISLADAQALAARCGFELIAHSAAAYAIFLAAVPAASSLHKRSPALVAHTGRGHFFAANHPGRGRVIPVDSVLPPMGDIAGAAGRRLDIMILVLSPAGNVPKVSGAICITRRVRCHHKFGTSIVDGVRRYTDRLLLVRCQVFYTQCCRPEESTETLTATSIASPRPERCDSASNLPYSGEFTMWQAGPERGRVIQIPVDFDADPTLMPVGTGYAQASVRQ